jgi:heme-degrading monooxygenase HmoA
MHAVVVRVNIGDSDTAEEGLREQVVPRVSQAPGFVAGYWTRSDDGSNGLSMIVFDSEDGARRAAEMIQGPEALRPETVTLESVEVREVLANA